MSISIADFIEKEDMACEDLIECITDSGGLDKRVYFMILEQGSMGLDELSEQMNRERSTIYRAVQRLEENGFLLKQKEGKEGGGYRHVYSAVPPEEVAEEMNDRLNEWYAEMGQMIHRFKEKYGEQ